MHLGHHSTLLDGPTFKHVWLETADEVTFGPPETRCGMGRSCGKPGAATWPLDVSDSTIKASGGGAHVPRVYPQISLWRGDDRRLPSPTALRS